MVIPSTLVEMGHHAVYLEAPLSMGWSLSLWSNGGEGVNDLRGKGSQGTHTGSIMRGRGVFLE